MRPPVWRLSFHFFVESRILFCFFFSSRSHLEHRADFSVSSIVFTDNRTPWTGAQLAARPLPKHRTTQTQNKCIHTPNIHALCGIRSHDPGFRANEDSTCLRPLGYRDRLRTYVLKLVLEEWTFNNIKRFSIYKLSFSDVSSDFLIL